MLNFRRSSMFSELFNDFRLAELDKLLANLATVWGFDIWAIHDLTNHSIYIVGRYLLKNWGIAECLEI